MRVTLRAYVAAAAVILGGMGGVGAAQPPAGADLLPPPPAAVPPDSGLMRLVPPAPPAGMAGTVPSCVAQEPCCPEDCCAPCKSCWVGADYLLLKRGLTRDRIFIVDNGGTEDPTTDDTPLLTNHNLRPGSHPGLYLNAGVCCDGCNGFEMSYFGVNQWGPRAISSPPSGRTDSRWISTPTFPSSSTPPTSCPSRTIPGCTSRT